MMIAVCRAWKGMVDTCDGELWQDAARGLVHPVILAADKGSSMAIQHALRWGPICK